jgi:hypothetical protein
MTTTAKCANCPKPAACVGTYEDSEGPLAFACDDCCGHGNEDGFCYRLADAPDSPNRALAAPVSAPVVPPPTQKALHAVATALLESSTGRGLRGVSDWAAGRYLEDAGIALYAIASARAAPVVPAPPPVPASEHMRFCVVCGIALEPGKQRTCSSYCDKEDAGPNECACDEGDLGHHDRCPAKAGAAPLPTPPTCGRCSDIGCDHCEPHDIDGGGPMITLREAAENAVGLLCDCETTDLGAHATDCTAWELFDALARAAPHLCRRPSRCCATAGRCRTFTPRPTTAAPVPTTSVRWRRTTLRASSRSPARHLPPPRPSVHVGSLRVEAANSAATAKTALGPTSLAATVSRAKR